MLLQGRSLGTLPVVLLAVQVVTPASPPLAIDSYEVKFTLDASASCVCGNGGSDPQLTDHLVNVFAVKKAAKKMTVNFLDDCQRTLEKRGWAIRIRETGDESRLTYKRRYPAAANVTAALQQASLDHFTQEGQKVEVDVASDRRTLSISTDKTLASTPQPDAFALAASATPPPTLPKDLLPILKASQVYGPIPAKRWKGQLPGGEEIEIEVWTLPGNCLVELSTRTPDAATADKLQGQLDHIVQAEHLAASGATLKTDAVLTAFKPAGCK